MSLYKYSRWTQAVISAFDEKMVTSKINKQNKKIIAFKLKTKIVSEESKMLRNKIVVVALDKVSGNAAFVCQTHYV